MHPTLALTTSIAVLGGFNTDLTATVFPILVWVTLIAWASFFACGGGVPGLVNSIASNWIGILIRAGLAGPGCHLGGTQQRPHNPCRVGRPPRLSAGNRIRLRLICRHDPGDRPWRARWLHRPSDPRGWVINAGRRTFWSSVRDVGQGPH
jgi:hypothetical protein